MIILFLCFKPHLLDLVHVLDSRILRDSARRARRVWPRFVPTKFSKVPALYSCTRSMYRGKFRSTVAPVPAGEHRGVSGFDINY